MTSPDHENGTERIAEVARIKQWPAEAVVVNLQGDEPLIPQSLIRLNRTGVNSASTGGHEFGLYRTEARCRCL